MKRNLPKINNKHQRPRLYIFRSNKHIYAQLINDYQNTIVATSSSISPELRPQIKSSKNCKTAQLIGEKIAQKLKTKGIYKIRFDRGNKIYHGRIKALAEAARNAGLKF